MKTVSVSLLLIALAAGAAVAQTEGTITGTVVNATTSQPLPGARVDADRRGGGAVTDATGRFSIRGIRPGVYRVTARAIGFAPVTRDSVAVIGGRVVVLEFQLQAEALRLPGIVVQADADPLLDPRLTATAQKITGTELRQLPVTTLEEAVALQAGVAAGSVRGGRVGEDVLVVDGFGVKNQLDASTGRLGINIPAIALQEAELVTNGFSSLYGQALSGVVSTVTRDGGDRIEGRLAYETDRPLPNGWDVGLDRFVLSLGGPLFGASRFFLAVDAQARIDDDPVHAPAPVDTLDPRAARPWLLPHNAGERYDLLGKITLPVGDRFTVRLLGVASETNRLLYDPELKYALRNGLGQQVSGRLGLLHLQHRSRPDSSNQATINLRVGYFTKEAMRAPLLVDPDRAFGAFSFGGLSFAGETNARTADSTGSLDAIPGFALPVPDDRTPWGVPAFFRQASSRGELAWNRFGELRSRLDLFLARGQGTDLRFGGEYVDQRVETFARLESFRSVAAGAPPPRRSAFEPRQGAAYAEVQHRSRDLTVTLGLRLDAFDASVAGDSLAAKASFGPRLAVSTLLAGATVTASAGRFVQPPDFQFLVDAAFDDTLRTGRFRRGNPSLGFETSTQFEFNIRARIRPTLGARIGAFVKRLDGLVASVPIGFDPDSAVFGNGDFGQVKGLEVTLEREFRQGFGARVSYVVQHAEATASDAFNLFRRLRILSTGDTVIPAAVQFPLDFDRRHAVIIVLRGRAPESVGAIIGGIEGSAVVRWSTGFPYTRTNLTGDSLLGLPNSFRLPSQFGVDMLLRRRVRLGRFDFGVYVDARNLTNRRNVESVRRDTGAPGPGEVQITGMAEQAYSEHPEPIPYESTRYRRFADSNGDGIIAGRDELFPMYERAARDFLQPLFAFGPPRLIRIGTEIGF